MKKKKKALIVLVVVLVLLVAWWYLFLGNKIKDASTEITKGDADTKALIVYFTRSGVITAEGSADAVTSASMNIHDGVTEAAAMQLQRLTGADLYEIWTERYYRNSFVGTAATAWIEETLNMRPGLAARPDDLSAYDGTPIYLATGEKDNYYGSESMKNAYVRLCKLYEQQGLTDAEINKLVVLDVKDQEYFTQRGYTDQHGGGMAFAKDGKIMGWLFDQH